MTPASPVAFDAHWQQLKARFDAAAPLWVRRHFAMLSASEIALIERLVVDGKTARGCLACLVCEALGGDVASAMPRAIAIECVQAASLVHDDFIDDDAVRRGRPALWTVLGARRAVLLGDVMFATALAGASALGHADVATLANAIAAVAAGAYGEPLDRDDVVAGLGEATGAKWFYDALIEAKTGALFGAAAKLGAIAADAPATLLEAAQAFGVRVGEAYQIADDAQDLLAALPAPAWPAAKVAALATVRARFGHDGLDVAFAETGAGTDEATRLRSQLRLEIDRRVQLACEVLESFPAGLPGALLRAAPSFIVGLQSAKA